MTNEELAREQMAAYMARVSKQYTPRRHATIVAHLALTFLVERAEAEAAVQRWLAQRTQE